VQNLADSQAILATKSVVEHPQVSKLLEGSELAPTARDTVLRGVADRMTIYLSALKSKAD